jgi:hypothetical protein
VATLVVSFPAGSDTGALLRRLATVLQMASGNVNDKCATGATTTLTIDNAPTGGIVSIQLAQASGPNNSQLFIV